MTATQDPIAHAARLLREAAEELRQAHTYHRSEGWQGETGAQSAYDVYMAAAQALEDWEQAIGAGGVQALSAAPAEQQAAPKAAPGVGNSGFDHKTAADLLNNKTVSDEAVRNFVAASRWAHDERAALSATLLAMHGVLTSREAEIALLKKALLEAEAAPKAAPWEQNESAYQRGYMDGMAKGRRDVDAAPQQEAQEPTEIPEEIERMAADRYKVVPSHESMFHRWAVVAGTGTQQLYLGREVECQNMARKFAGAFLDGAFVAMQRTAPQPAPAPLSESIDQVERALAIIGVVGAIDGHDVVRRESVLEIARRAALAAQGGK